MSLFHYPKQRHNRRLSPTVFKRYQTYKRYLQTEFSRVCVYCRQPDCGARNINMHVDHYRPKSDPRFSNLICAYSNLYYSCAECNTLKSNYWPENGTGPLIVNPCDFVMADHLRYNSKTGKVEIRNQSEDGDWTIELLDLNGDATVAYRKVTQTTIAALEIAIESEKADLAEIREELRRGAISQLQYHHEAREIQDQIDEYQLALNAHSGLTPLPPLRARKLNVQLIT